MNITVVGLGLIGGSLAKAITKYTNHHVLGIDTNEDVLKQALECGAIHEIGKNEDLINTDITIISVYLGQTISFVKENAKYFKKGSIVTDACGVKSDICSEIFSIAKENGFTFVGGHPMAGKEVFGFEHSQAELFENASYIFTPENENEKAVEVLSALAYEIKFARVVVTTPHEHDRRIAYTSQVPHALACAYVLMPESIHHKGFSAGSFRDVSRVAKINEVMWSELFVCNKAALSDQLEILIDNLKHIKKAVDKGDTEHLNQILKQGREIKESVE